MPRAFSRVADELNPDYVPEWALGHRRPVPQYAIRLLSTFGTYWLPRLGLTIQLLGALALAAIFVAGAARNWAFAIVLFLLGLVLIATGALMWQSYRMRHWLPDGAAATAPLVAPVKVRAGTWLWMALAVIDAVVGTGLWMWTVSANPGARALLFGAAIYSLCVGTSSAVLVKHLGRISYDKVTFGGMTARRASIVLALVGLAFALIVFLQLPFLQGRLLPAT